MWELQVTFRTTFWSVSAICPKMGRLSIQVGEEFAIFLGIRKKSPYLCNVKKKQRQNNNKV